MTLDYNSLEELLAEDFLKFGSSRITYNKTIELEAAKNQSSTSPFEYTLTDFDIKMLALDVLLATYRILIISTANLPWEVPSRSLTMENAIDLPSRYALLSKLNS